MKLSWSFNGKYDDGSVVSASEFKGFLVIVNDGAAVALPASLAPDGLYSLDLSDPKLAAIDQTKTATYVIKMRTVALVSVNGQNVTRESVDSVPLTYKTDVRKPNGPFGLAIS